MRPDKAKTVEEYFVDWEAEVFGFGYGTGEKHTLSSLRRFLELCVHSSGDSYDFQELEREIGETVAWLLINILCRADIIEYGTSPRYGWLTTQGKRLQVFCTTRTSDALYDLVMAKDNPDCCSPYQCNCGEDFVENKRCPNPFFSA